MKILVLGWVLMAYLANGAVLETAHWQSKIDDAAAKGGGKVVVPPGVHPVGQLDLRSNVELHLERGAVLEGAAGMENYRIVRLPCSEGTWSAVVAGFGVTNVAITGEGEINGRGERFSMDFRNAPKCECTEGLRPRGIFFADSVNIKMEDFTLRDAGCWGIVFKCCDGVVARRIKIDNHAHHNNDGFDVEAKNVLIEDCDVDAGDDGICIKSNTPDFCVEDILVRRCVVRSHCNGMKLGTASHGTMRRIKFEDCRTEAPRRTFIERTPGYEGQLAYYRPGYERFPAGVGISAICVECVDGGIVEDITYDRIEVAGFQVPIFVRGGTRTHRKCGIPPNNKFVLRNILIRNVKGFAESPIPSSISGVKGCIPVDVRLENVSIVCHCDTNDVRKVSVPGPEYAGKYPEATMFRKLRLPAFGMFVDLAEKVSFKNVIFKPDVSGDNRPPIYISPTVTMVHPTPRAAMLNRLRDDVDVIGIVHWGLNTYTDREWGYGDEDPKMLNPANFDAEQIVAACKDGGIRGLVVVAKHHDGFCLWPTKTTSHNISRSPFRGGRGDYVKEMSDACRKLGVKFGVYVSPWDRNNSDYGTEKYVETYHQQIKELLGGYYGEVFEMWFDGANGGDGYYGGAKETRKIWAGYYRFDEVFSFVRALQPSACIFAGEANDSDLRWPGNEKGILGADSRATICANGGYANGKYGNPYYKSAINTGDVNGDYFRVCEADFPLRKGWFYHDKENGTTRSAAYLTKLYLSSVGNGGVMNIGVAPNRDGQLVAADVDALKGFKAIKDELFKQRVEPTKDAFNVVVMREDISCGERVDNWQLMVDNEVVAAGTAIGNKRIRVFDNMQKGNVKLVATGGGIAVPVEIVYYSAKAELLKTVVTASTNSGETDTALIMTGKKKEKR